MSYLNLFHMPKQLKITGRSSSITNAFVSTLIPTIKPTSEQVEHALGILGMDKKTCRCAYCGDPNTEWDHLRPLVVDKMPTGYISEIHNLVPACGKCNQSKGNKIWDDWIVSGANLSPKTRAVKDLKERIDRLHDYEKWIEPTKLDFESLIDKEQWRQHWSNCEKIQNLMKQSQILASEISKQVAHAYSRS